MFSAAITYPLVRALVPPTLPRLDEMRLDLTVLAFGLLITIVSGIVSGTFQPFGRRDSILAIVDSSGERQRTLSRAPARQVLIAAQVALATTPSSVLPCCYRASFACSAFRSDSNRIRS